MSSETIATTANATEAARVVARERFEIDDRELVEALATDEGFGGSARIYRDLRREQNGVDEYARRHLANAIDEVGLVLDAHFARVCVETDADVEAVLGGQS